MPRRTDRKHGVLSLDLRENTPDHERAAQRKLAGLLATLLHTHVVDAEADDSGDFYYLPNTTLIDPARFRHLGITAISDFFGGLVSHPYMATKAISHPLPANATFPLGWTDDFARHASDALLKGYTVFTRDDALRAAPLLLRDGPLRLKPVRATAGRGQVVIDDLDMLAAELQRMDEHELAVWGLVLEENLSDVRTFSVGQVLVGGITCSYYGEQSLTHDNQGESVYGGSDLILVRGDYEQLLQLELDDALRLAITQARTYEQAAINTFPGFLASRRNYDVARGLTPEGHVRSGVLEQSWRMGGASSAELLALQAFADDPALQRVRASTHEIFGEATLPADATLIFQGDDCEVGRICKYARIRAYDHP